MSEDGRLLRQYREQGSQAAFARLAARHLGFVYATCLRETGDAAQAEDAAQAVFLLLARRAPALRPEQSLSVWLFQTARFAAKNARRRDARRRAWEERAMKQTPPSGQEKSARWDRLGPAVNDALTALVPSCLGLGEPLVVARLACSASNVCHPQAAAHAPLSPGQVCRRE